MRAAKWATSPIVFLLLVLSGCSEVKGRVTNAASGDPISGAEVGLMILDPFAFEAMFREQTTTDDDGQYRFVHGEANPWVAVRMENFLSVTRDVASASSVTLDVALQSITPIKGTWNATITVEGAEIPATRFVFNEGGMAWRADDDFLGETDYTFDGDTVTIDGGLGSGDVLYGDLTSSLVLNEAGDSLTGSIAFFHDFFTEAGCVGGCTGTVVAVPVAR